MIVLRPAVQVRGRNDELLFSPDGSKLASPRRGRRCLLWTDLTNGARAESVLLPDGAGEMHAAFSADARTLFVGTDLLFAVDLESRKAAQVPTDRWRTVLFGVAPDGALMVVEHRRNANSATLSCFAPGAYADPLWHLDTGTWVYRAPLFPRTGTTFILIEAPYHESPKRVTRSLATGEVLDTSAHALQFEEVVLSPDASLIATTVRDTLHLYPGAGSWDGVPRFGNDGKKHFTGVAFHPNGQYLAATSNDETVKLFDVTTREQLRSFKWDIGRMRSVCFSPDGLRAAAGSDTGKVVVWDVDV